MLLAVIMNTTQFVINDNYITFDRICMLAVISYRGVKEACEGRCPCPKYKLYKPLYDQELEGPERPERLERPEKPERPERPECKYGNCKPYNKDGYRSNEYEPYDF